MTNLTKREQQIYDLLKQGIGTAEMAKQLFVSPKTISSHKERIAYKLGLSSVKEFPKHFAQLAAA